MTHPLLLHSQADPQDFEQMVMVSPLLTVRDFRIGLSYEVADEGELLGNYAFNISQRGHPAARVALHRRAHVR